MSDDIGIKVTGTKAALFSLRKFSSTLSAAKLAIVGGTMSVVAICYAANTFFANYPFEPAKPTDNQQFLRLRAKTNVAELAISGLQSNAKELREAIGELTAELAKLKNESSAKIAELEKKSDEQEKSLKRVRAQNLALEKENAALRLEQTKTAKFFEELKKPLEPKLQETLAPAPELKCRPPFDSQNCIEAKTGPIRE